MSKEQVNIFVPTFFSGGIENNAVFTANGLADEGYNVNVLYVREEGGQFLNFSDKVNKIKLGPDLKIPYFNQNALDGVLVLYSLYKLLRQQKRESKVVTISYISNIICVIASYFARTPCAVRLSCHPLSAQKISGIGTKISLRLKPLFYGLADIVFANSIDNAECFKKILKREVGMIYNPATAVSEINNKCELHPWLKNKTLPTIVSAGRFNSQKDFPLLLNAFTNVLKKVKARLVIFGEGGLRSEFEQIIKDNNIEEYVSLPGFINNYPEQVAYADLFVLSSNVEGLPNVLVEAVSAGTPAISTACESGPREILLDGTGGDLIPVGDLEKMTEAIIHNLTDRKYALNKAKIASAQNDRFKPQIIIYKYKELVEKLFKIEK